MKKIILDITINKGKKFAYSIKDLDDNTLKFRNNLTEDKLKDSINKFIKENNVKTIRYYIDYRIYDKIKKLLNI